MANHKSAKKRILVSAKRKIGNKSAMSRMKTVVKKAFDATEVEKADLPYKEAVSLIDKMVAKGRLHKNTAARKKSQLTSYKNKLAPAK